MVVAQGDLVVRCAKSRCHARRELALATLVPTSASTQTRRYGPPVVASIAGPGKVDASAAGGVAITIHGDNFGADDTSLGAVASADGFGPERFIARKLQMPVEPHRSIACFTSGGAVGAQSSGPSPSTARLRQTPTTSVAHQKYGELRIGVEEDLPTAGGSSVTLVGANFGVRDDRIDSVTFGPTGRAYCDGLRHRRARRPALVCKTPAGVGRELRWRVRIGGQG